MKQSMSFIRGRNMKGNWRCQYKEKGVLMKGEVGSRKDKRKGHGTRAWRGFLGESHFRGVPNSQSYLFVWIIG